MPRHSPCALFSLTFRRSSPHMFRIHPVSFRFQAECSDVGDFSSQIKTRFAGLLICFGERFFIASLSVNQIDSPIGSLISWIMQAHVFRSLLSVKAKIVFYPKKIIYPLLLPSHNCIIIISLCSVFKVHLWVSKKLNEASIPWNFSQFLGGD